MVKSTEIGLGYLLTCIGLAHMWGPATGSAATSAGSREGARRHALVVAANEGGRERTTLRYAHEDARAFAEVLVELGGVEGRDQILVLDARREALTQAFERLGERVGRSRKEGGRQEVVFYYSGHSDEKGLLLGGERYDYQELHDQLSALDADVRVAVLDSCSSGAMTRLKGGKRRPPFLADESRAVEGRAYLTSSSATEAAQESDAVEGSFFTHYLVSGLRGGADHNSDGQVTLSEAYQYSFDETLARTETTEAGPQHASYDFRLNGFGDFVMTDLRSNDRVGTLQLAEGLWGRVYVRDTQGALVAELNHRSDKPLVLGLPQGEYDVQLVGEGSLRGAHVAIRAGEARLLDGGELEDRQVDKTQTRGEDGQDPELEDIPLCFSFIPGLGTCSSLEGRKYRTPYSLNVLAGAVHEVTQADLSAIGGVVIERMHGAQLAGVAAYAGELQGVQGSGVAGFVRGNVRGAQLGGVLTSAAGSLSAGAQLAGVGNLAWEGVGRGVQVAGVLNISGGSVEGGAQLAGVANYAGGEVRGAQLSLLNVAGGVTGAQVGLVNVARRVSGHQVGLLNLAKEYESGDGIGLLSLSGNGRLHIDLWSSALTISNLSLKVGTERVYSMLTIGYSPAISSAGLEARARWGLGLGVRFLERGAWTLASDFSWYDVAKIENGARLWDAVREQYRDSADTWHSQLRVMALREVGDMGAIFAGFGLNTRYAWGEEEDRYLSWGAEQEARIGDLQIGAWPAVFGGFQF